MRISAFWGLGSAHRRRRAASSPGERAARGSSVRARPGQLVPRRGRPAIRRRAGGGERPFPGGRRGRGAPVAGQQFRVERHPPEPAGHHGPPGAAGRGRDRFRAAAAAVGTCSSSPRPTPSASTWRRRTTRSWEAQYGLERIDAFDAWDVTAGSPGVIVAVLDSGTDIDHSDLACNIWVNPGEDLDEDGVVWDADDFNGVDDDGNGLVDDLARMGLRQREQRPLAGPSSTARTWPESSPPAPTTAPGWRASPGGLNGFPGVKMMAVGVGDFGPSGSILDDSILYAADEGARVITLSLSVGTSSAINAALDAAYADGVFIDNASGNSNGNVGYPATHPAVMAVGATDQNDNRASFFQLRTDARSRRARRQHPEHRHRRRLRELQRHLLRLASRRRPGGTDVLHRARRDERRGAELHPAHGRRRGRPAPARTRPAVTTSTDGAGSTPRPR